MVKSFSVLMSLYAKERPEYLRECIESILRQTAVPDEIVIVKDGPLTNALECVLSEYISQSPALYTDLGITPRQQGGKLYGKQIRVGTGNINIHIKIQTERFDGFFPMLYSLQLVKNQISLSDFGDQSADMVVKT